MHQTITKITGLTVNVEVVEVCQTDQNGGIIWYHAAIWIQRRGMAEKVLVRTSRLPGTAAEVKREIQRDGIRAFDRLSRA